MHTLFITNMKNEREYYEKLKSLKSDLVMGLKQIENKQFVDLDFDTLFKESDKIAFQSTSD